MRVTLTVDHEMEWVELRGVSDARTVLMCQGGNQTGSMHSPLILQYVKLQLYVYNVTLCLIHATYLVKNMN